MIEEFRIVSIVAALLALGSGGVAASASARDSAPPFSCMIQSEETRTGVHMKGSLTAVEPVTGTYSLKIQSDHAEMTLTVQQAGEFEAAADAPAQLGSATLPGNAGDYQAHLRIDWNGRTYACVVIGPEVRAVEQPALP